MFPITRRRGNAFCLLVEPHQQMGSVQFSDLWRIRVPCVVLLLRSRFAPATMIHSTDRRHHLVCFTRLALCATLREYDVIGYGVIYACERMKTAKRSCRPYRYREIMKKVMAVASGRCLKLRRLARMHRNRGSLAPVQETREFRRPNSSARSHFLEVEFAFRTRLKRRRSRDQELKKIQRDRDVIHKRERHDALRSVRNDQAGRTGHREIGRLD